jgi:hypothetical protein
MGKVYEAIDDRISDWIAKQQLYFVATAPGSEEGHVNCSPKGLDTLRVLGPRALAFLDLGGSGVETIAHLKENGRIVIMMCAFAGAPRIFRFHGRGEVLAPGHPDFTTLLAAFPVFPSVRSIIRVAVTRISDSCGYGVPRYEYRGDRDAMENWLRSKTEKEMAAYRAAHNRLSIDALPGLEPE